MSKARHLSAFVASVLGMGGDPVSARVGMGASAGFNFVQGLTLSNNAADAVNDIDASPGAAQAGSVYVASSGTMTKRLDAAWSPGNNGGGLDTGTKANSATYHTHSLRKISDGSFDWLYSLSPTAPTVPAGYVAVQRLIPVMTDAGGAIIPFKQSGNTVIYKTALNDYTGGNRAAALLTLRVPSGIRTRAIFGLYLSLRVGSDSGLTALVFDGEDITLPTGQTRFITSGVGGDMRMMEGFTNTSRQIGLSIVQAFGVQSGNHELHTYGFEDYQIPRLGA